MSSCRRSRCRPPRCEGALPWLNFRKKHAEFIECNRGLSTNRVAMTARTTPPKPKSGLRGPPPPPASSTLLYCLPQLLESPHAPQRPLRPDSSQQRYPHRPPTRADSQSDDRQAPQADRASREKESPDPLPAGTFLRTLFL